MVERPAGDGGAPAFFSRQVGEARRFYLDLAPPAGASLEVVCGGYERCAPDYAIRRDTFAYYSIEFVWRGRRRLTLGGRAYSLTPGVVFSYGPGVAQHITTDPKDRLGKYFVDFAGGRAAEALQRSGLPPGGFARVRRPGQIQEVFELLINDGSAGGGFTADLCRALLEYLLVKLADARVPWRPRRTLAYATFERCREHLTTHYRSIRSLEQAARQCHVDRAYLCRLFRRFDHQTPYQLLMRLKMNDAAQLLHDRRLLVKQVAARVGFDDPLHFSRVFKKVFGVSPEAFRRLR